MKVSVVTAVLNRVSTISATIDSVQLQSWKNVEHIIQDGGSTDGTIDMIMQRSQRNTILSSERDNGIYDAINRGIRRSTGEIIGLMHSDDVFAHSHVLEKVVAAFSNPTVEGVYGDLQYVAGDDPDHIIRYWRSGKFFPGLIKKGWMPPHPTLYLRREVYERYGLYDTSFQISADYEAILRFLVRGEISLAYIPEVLVRMRMGGESNRSLERILVKSREDLRAMRNYNVGGFPTLLSKNLRKIYQFVSKGNH